MMSRSMSASRLTMVILCMTMSTTLLSRDCHFSRAALLKLWPAPFFWNFFLETERKGGLGPLSDWPCTDPAPAPARPERQPWVPPGRLTWRGGRRGQQTRGGPPRSG